MAFGFPARFKENRPFNLQQDELFAAVELALKNLNWLGFEVAPDKSFYKRLKSSPMTFGEDLTVNILPNGIVYAESICVEGGRYRMPQIFDFGVNRQNVEMFFGELARILSVKDKSISIARQTISVRFGLTPKFIERRMYRLTRKELAIAVKTTFERLEWVKYPGLPNVEFQIKLHHDKFWGEELTIRFPEDETIEAESFFNHSPAGRPMLIDIFGTNRKNVEMFFTEFEKTIKDSFQK